MARIDEISKNFRSDIEEPRIYREWEEAGYFSPEPNPDREPFTIAMPPPNITGELHMGHALNLTMQDVLIRWKRMAGYETLWVPGTDHASIATEAKIVDAMRSEGLSKDDLGREGFMERAWEWREKYGRRINDQIRSLGCSCDWQRERFTMDEGLSAAVTEVFVRLYEEGLIYRGERMVHWCPHCYTSLSDAEVEYEERETSLWEIKYPLTGETDVFLTVATTRPETMLGDTALAVHPDDERYRDYIGRTVTLPLVGREIPIVADAMVEPGFGTGVVKITPAHDPADFDVALRHGLPLVEVINDHGMMSAAAGEKYAGMTADECRRAVVADLQELALIPSIKRYDHNVGTCYRCGTFIEPRVSLQWFVRMKEMAAPAIEAALNGDVKFFPERFTKVYINWLENIRDWCISRQLWWGHRIPAWYCSDCDGITVARETPARCSHCGGTNLRQDDDSLDTWFSSALWPFSILGWPEETADYKYFYPNSMLVTGYDIIFFWVARMIFSGIHQTGRVPFHTVFFNGIVRDDQGRKMSKSLGNGTEPMEEIATYGCDALRYSLIAGTAPGNDQRYLTYHVKAGAAFVNKIWNAYRFIMMNYPEDDSVPAFAELNPAELPETDRWILSKLQQTIAQVSADLEKLETGMAFGRVYSFIWDLFCDWYIEMAKPRLRSTTAGEREAVLSTLCHVLAEGLKLLHPFMPFITEAVYQGLPPTEGSIMVAAWPQYDPSLPDPELESDMEVILELVGAVRALRAEYKVPPSREIGLVLQADIAATAERVSRNLPVLTHLAAVTELGFIDAPEEAPSLSATVVFKGGTIYVPLADLVDLKQELERLSKEAEQHAAEIERLDRQLNNPQFVERAPAAVVEKQRERRAEVEKLLAGVQSRLEQLSE
ncbi:MAG: valine--tRNA ligase [Clostridiaceae bacterium]|nr:valine--tRNA ligase [Clostridiaceae bacterium]